LRLLGGGRLIRRDCRDCRQPQRMPVATTVSRPPRTDVAVGPPRTRGNPWGINGVAGTAWRDRVLSRANEPSEEQHPDHQQTKHLRHRGGNIPDDPALDTCG